jgi:PAS domain S-box-containing protein
MSALLLQQLLDACPDMLAVFDDEGRVLACNAAFANRVGMGTGRQLAVTLGLDVQRWDKAVVDARSGIPTTCVSDVFTASGHHTVLECSLSPLSQLPEGGIDAVSLRIRDVTEEHQHQYQAKQYAAQLNEIVQRYEAISHATHDAIWDWLADENTITWSRGVCTNFGHDVRVTSLTWWEDHIHPDDVTGVVASLHEWTTSSRETWSTEYRFRCADGSYRWVYDRGLVMEDAGRRRYIGAMIDISQIRCALDRISQQNEVLREIASMSAHQLRGPLTSLMGLLYLYDKAHPSNPINAQVIDYLDVAARNLDDVIHQVIQRTALAVTSDHVEPAQTPER